MHYFPSNRPNDYTTRLRRPIHLDGEWEVALMDVQYKYHSFIYSKLTMIDIVVILDRSMSMEEFARYYVADDKERVEMAEAESYWHPLYPSKYAKLEDFLTHINEKVRAGRVPGRIRRGVPQFEYDYVEDRIRYRFGLRTVNSTYFLVLHTGAASRMMGISSGATTIANRWDAIKLEGKTGLLPDTPADSPRNNPQTMYIYSDLIKYQLVGDVEAPLLGVIPIHTNKDEPSFSAISPTYYLPVNKKDIDSINISVMTSTGQPFPFGTSADFIARLHFQRVAMRV